jgi:hypothetical protein
VNVKEIECTDLKVVKSGEPGKRYKTNNGIFLPNSLVVFEKMEGSLLRLTGKR